MLRPSNLKEYCWDLVLLKCLTTAGGNDEHFAEKSCGDVVLSVLAKALSVVLHIGAHPGTPVGGTADGSYFIRPEQPSEGCLWQGLTLRLIYHKAHFCLALEA